MFFVKISLARLPVTGSDVFGREQELTFLDQGQGKQECQTSLQSLPGPVLENPHS